MKDLRPFAWVIIGINALLFYSFISGVAELGSDGSSDVAAGIYIFIALIILAVVNIVLYVLYRVTGTKKRVCPACGQNVKKGLTVCPSCSFDFMKAAKGSTE